MNASQAAISSADDPERRGDAGRRDPPRVRGSRGWRGSAALGSGAARASVAALGPGPGVGSGLARRLRLRWRALAAADVDDVDLVLGVVAVAGRRPSRARRPPDGRRPRPPLGDGWASSAPRRGPLIRPVSVRRRRHSAKRVRLGGAADERRKRANRDTTAARQRHTENHRVTGLGRSFPILVHHESLPWRRPGWPRTGVYVSGRPQRTSGTPDAWRRGSVVGGPSPSSLLTLLVPGSAQLAAGNRGLGRFAVRVWCVLARAGRAARAVFLLQPVAGLRHARPGRGAHRRASGLLVGFAALWAVLFVDAWRLGRPATLVIKARRWLTAHHRGRCSSSPPVASCMPRATWVPAGTP